MHTAIGGLQPFGRDSNNNEPSGHAGLEKQSSVNKMFMIRQENFNSFNETGLY